MDNLGEGIKCGNKKTKILIFFTSFSSELSLPKNVASFSADVIGVDGDAYTEHFVPM